MTNYAHLWLFFVILLGVVMLPGLDMAYVLGSALHGGRRHGLVATAGMTAAALIHVTVGALGLSALLHYWPMAFNMLLLAGALYIAWLGLSLLRSESYFNGALALQSRTGWKIFRQAMATNLMNPKAYVFMLAVFPQFLRPEYGALWVQTIMMWAIIAATQLTVYGSVAVVAGGLSNWFQQNPGASLIINRSVGAMLVLAALLTALNGWTNI